MDMNPHDKPASTAEGLGDLFKKLARDMGGLLRNEIRLAKMEMAQASSTLVLDTVQILVAIAVASVGGLTLVVALVLGIGVLLGGAYWAGALIAGTVLVATGGLLAARAIRELKRTSLKPEATLDTLQEDRAWAKDQMRELARGVSR